MDFELGDIVGWHVDVLHRAGEEPTEMRGEVVAIHGNFLAIRSLHIVARNHNPFHGCLRDHCYLISKKAA